MCFTETVSWIFVGLAWTSAAFIYKFIPSMYFFGHTFIFLSGIELLQALSYPLLDQCDNFWNQLLTFLSLTHICIQPTVLNWLAANEYKHNPAYYERYLFSCRLSALWGVWFLARAAAEISGITKSNLPDECKFTYSNEMIRGENLCSYTGRLHMGWSVPLADNHYFWPSIHMHGFFMYCTLLVQPEDPTMVFKGLMMLILGPVLGLYLTPDGGEAGAIWCLQSTGRMFIGAVAHFFLVNGGKFDTAVATVEKKIR